MTEVLAHGLSPLPVPRLVRLLLRGLGLVLYSLEPRLKRG